MSAELDIWYVIDLKYQINTEYYTEKVFSIDELDVRYLSD